MRSQQPAERFQFGRLSVKLSSLTTNLHHLCCLMITMMTLMMVLQQLDVVIIMQMSHQQAAKAQYYTITTINQSNRTNQLGHSNSRIRIDSKSRQTCKRQSRIQLPCLTMHVPNPCPSRNPIPNPNPNAFSYRTVSNSNENLLTLQPYNMVIEPPFTGNHTLQLKPAS